MRALQVNSEERSLLLKEVWGAADADAVLWPMRFHAYENHYLHLLLHSPLITPPLEDLKEAKDVVNLVGLVKSSCRQGKTIGGILDQLERERFQWLHEPDGKDLENCLELAVKLWLFVKPCLQHHDVSLREAVMRSLPSKTTHRQPPTSTSGPSPAVDSSNRLSEDFSARNLERKGGFRIDWTSQLREHLTFPDKSTILVFRHARTLQDYQKLKDESSMYPDGLLLETDRTIGLLFPWHKKGAEKRLRKLSKKEKADVEANWLDEEIEDFQRLQLSSYPIYQQRLLLIQQRYDNAKPSRPKQWWYDRRRRLEWAGLWIAVMVFILTLVTVATTVMQVYAGFHFH